MNNRRKNAADRTLTATIPNPRPGDFIAGSLKSRAAARATVDIYVAEKRRKENIEIGELNAFEQAITEAGETAEIKTQMVRLARVAQVRARIFGLSLPSPAEIRHNQKVAREINRISGGNESSLAISNPAEWNRLRAVITEKLSE